jgi:hypothetical protein
MDPDTNPSLFISGFQDADKKKIFSSFFFYIIYYRYPVLTVGRRYIYMCLKRITSHKTAETKVFLNFSAQKIMIPDRDLGGPKTWIPWIRIRNTGFLKFL